MDFKWITGTKLQLTPKTMGPQVLLLLLLPSTTAPTAARATAAAAAATKSDILILSLSLSLLPQTVKLKVEADVAKKDLYGHVLVVPPGKDYKA